MLDLAERTRRRAARHRPLRAHRARRRTARSCAPRRDPAKDQAYMLARLDPALLDRLEFPLGATARSRTCARSPRPPGCRSPSKPESQDLCFLAGTSAARLHARATTARPTGPARSSTSAAARSARHDGQHRFTVGQRRGLGVSSPEPLYVLRKDPATNRVTVGPAQRARRAGRSRSSGATLHRDARRGRPRQAALPLRADPLPRHQRGRRRAPRPPRAGARRRGARRRARARPRASCGATRWSDGRPSPAPPIPSRCRCPYR